MKNIPLLLFDLICLPITVIRLILIYFFGSRYNIPSIQFLDVMIHATNRFFNQGQQNITIDTVPTDVRLSINRASRIDAELLDEYAKFSLEKRNKNNDTKSNDTKSNDTKSNDIKSNDIKSNDNDIKSNSSNQKKSIFGQKGETTIVLHSDKNVTNEEIKRLQRLLPKILSQISLMSDDKNDYIDTDNIDISKLDKKLDDEIKNELDFLSYDPKDVDLGLDSITDN